VIAGAVVGGLLGIGLIATALRWVFKRYADKKVALGLQQERQQNQSCPRTELDAEGAPRELDGGAKEPWELEAEEKGKLGAEGRQSEFVI
jgi:hypothetical protein